MGMYPATKVVGKCRDRKLPRRRQANVRLYSEFSVMRDDDDDADTVGAKLTRNRACNSRAGVLLRRRSVRALAIVRNHQVIERAIDRWPVRATVAILNAIGWRYPNVLVQAKATPILLEHRFRNRAHAVRVCRIVLC